YYDDDNLRLHSFPTRLSSDLGSLWGVGYNSHGVFGAQTSLSTLTKISDGPWIDIAAGINHILVAKNDGTLWAWGSNEHGQLGDGDRKSTRLNSSHVKISYAVF